MKPSITARCRSHIHKSLQSWLLKFHDVTKMTTNKIFTEEKFRNQKKRRRKVFSRSFCEWNVLA
ncbi:CLUMA_CG005887, isoform A [Clunio marinus]|uniref:CLUMA_CG005887, isoform A n=1 Tax=Clunio marinus TaxID=568069 RepID=A0A1J1HW95_9DIPT|nr:CLUMA_CG005887, isoform A [Clunio marinus]